MGMDLIGRNDVFSLNWTGWRLMYETAVNNGWEPVGTEPNERAPQMPDRWDGGYFSNDFQIVTAEDAANMADALDRSLEFNVTDDDEYIIDFIRFARGGAFKIG